MSGEQNNDSANDADKPVKDQEKLGFLHVLTSVLAAAIGVQSKKNQAKDFQNKASIYIYIGAGIIFTTIFVFTLYWVVQAVLNHAGI